MEFENKDHKKAYERISKMMVDLYGEAGATASTDRPHWRVSSGSATVHVSVTTWRDNINIVQFNAYLALGTETTESCMRYLLVENHTMVFGGFSIDTDGDIAYSHSVIAETCTKSDVQTIIGALRYTADKYDDIIVERWGGKRFND